MPKSKVITIGVLIIFICTMFTGCLSTSFNMDKVTVIQGIGVDFDFKSKKYKVTLQCYNLQKSSPNKEGGSGGSITKIIIGKGESIERAIDDTIQVTGENPILSQNRVIILSETVVANGIYTAIDAFTRNYRIRATVPIAISKGFEAGDILKTTDGDVAVPSETIKNILQSDEINSYLKLTSVADVIRMKEEKTTSITIPALTVIEEDKKLYARLYGVAVFKGDFLFKYLKDKETRIFLAIIGDMKKGTYAVQKTPLGIATFEILDSNTKTKLNLNSDNTLKYSLKTKITVDLTELEFRRKHNLSEQEIKKIEKAGDKYIANYMRRVLEKCLKDYRCDIFRIGRRLFLKYPGRYRELSDRWDDYLPKIQTSVVVQTTVRRIGRFTVTR